MRAGPCMRAIFARNSGVPSPTLPSCSRPKAQPGTTSFVRLVTSATSSATTRTSMKSAPTFTKSRDWTRFPPPPEFRRFFAVPICWSKSKRLPCSGRRPPASRSSDMRFAFVSVMAAVLACTTSAQTPVPCSCGHNPPGPPELRSLKPYTGAPDDLRPFSKFTTPYFEHYQDLVEYNGAARDIPDPDQVMGNRMLKGATLAIDEANAGGGYGGKPFKLMLHNDSAIWGAASNEIVKMVYDEKVWAMFGSISSDTTHIALRVTLKAETPLVNSASTDPTIPETIIPWYFTDLQDDRLQGYTLARHIYSELGLKRVAILRVNDRYGRFGVLKFRDASRRLGHRVVLEEKFRPGDTDF